MNDLVEDRRFLKWLLAALAVLWILTAIAPLSRRDWLLENLLVFVAVGVLAATYRRLALSDLSYGLFGVFLVLHMVGAHYTYSEVPAGFWARDAFGLARNHYDRLVHFMFGLLLAYPIREVLIRGAGVRPAWSYVLTVMCVLGFSGFYEALEGIVAMLVSPELGLEYLGTQGDEWDAQKDTALAFLGAVIAMSWLRWRPGRA
jgi:putative membrane protein